MEENMIPSADMQPSTKRTYTLPDVVYAWLSLLFAFLFCMTLPAAKYPLGGFLLVLALYISGFVLLRLKKQKPSTICIVSALSALVIASALLLTESKLVIKLSLAYALASHCFFFYSAFGNRIEEGFSNYIYIDYLRALFVLPLRSLGAIFQALSDKSVQTGSRFLLKCLVGIGIAIIPTALVFAFLSYDTGFMNILDGIFSFEADKIRRIIVSLIFTLPLGMYGFGLYAASSGSDLSNKPDVSSCEKGLAKVRILPQLTAVVAVAPIVFLYVVFFISQWKYYVSGFTGVLPEAFSYAEYARQGFFELCCVSVINIVLIIGIAIFIKRGKSGSSVILKIVSVVFCLCTLILISTAVAKLVMYIESYGLTQKRVYAMWLMVLIGLVFIVIAVGQFVGRLKAVALSLCLALVMFAGLAVCNVNALCARYNTDRYLSGSLEVLDLDAMKELGDSAIPSLVHLAESMDSKDDPQLKRAVDLYLHNEASGRKDEKESFFSFSLPSALADSALRDHD